jgi:hypothetical protein
MTPDALPAAWKARAESFRAHGADAQARTLEHVAGELEDALREAGETELTLSEAAAESGYSERRLRELLAEDPQLNAGRKGRPRIRREDLPRKPGGKSSGGYDPAADARDILSIGGAR